MTQNLHCGRFVLNAGRPLIMGIVNLSDDSFSGDGLHGNTVEAIAQGQRMIDEGAHILDIGAESSRPGAAPVPAQQEIDRLLPVIEALRDCGTPLSIDTVKPEVMRVALAAGADMINDINALRAPGALAIVAASRAAVCLMHMQGEPDTMQDNLATKYVGDEIHPAESVEEKVSLSERFGLWISFYPFNQDEYLDIAAHWLQHFGWRHGMTEEVRTAALQWALLRGSRSGRVAGQFARDWAGKQ